MIRLSVLYANSEGGSFDVEYYKSRHMKLVREKLGPYGLIGCEVDEGVEGMDGAPAPYAAIGYVFFDTVEQFKTGFSAVGEELLADVPNYTNIEPIIQISDYTKV